VGAEGVEGRVRHPARVLQRAGRQGGAHVRAACCMPDQGSRRERRQQQQACSNCRSGRSRVSCQQRSSSPPTIHPVKFFIDIVSSHSSGAGLCGRSKGRH
jgi:hypothetical protein